MDRSAASRMPAASFTPLYHICFAVRVLFVSMSIVKTHLKHIYGKLDVRTRTQAVARARELHILLP